MNQVKDMLMNLKHLTVWGRGSGSAELSGPCASSPPSMHKCSALGSVCVCV